MHSDYRRCHTSLQVRLLASQEISVPFQSLSVRQPGNHSGWQVAVLQPLQLRQLACTADDTTLTIQNLATNPLTSIVIQIFGFG